MYFLNLDMKGRCITLTKHHSVVCICRFNAKDATMVPSKMMKAATDVGYRWAQGEELFGQFKVPCSISPDDTAGRLLLRTRGAVLLRFGGQPSEVYEALIEKIEDDSVTVRLSAQCCRELSLAVAKVVKVEAQFQVNRVPLCEMHDNIDRLKPEHIERILFPTLSVRTPRHQVRQMRYLSRASQTCRTVHAQLYIIHSEYSWYFLQ